MDSIIVAARLPTAGGESRDKIIDLLRTASVYSKEKEPGVLKYMVCLPRDKLDDKSVWAIEEYASKQVLDEHMETPPVKEMIAHMTSNPTVLAEAPTIRYLSWLDDLHFVKPEAGKQQDPLIVFGHIQFVEGKREATMKYFESDVNSTKSETGTFVYGMLSEKDKPDDAFTVEVYESEKYLNDVHLQSNALQETVKQTKEMLSGFQDTKLKLVAGFVGR